MRTKWEGDSDEPHGTRQRQPQWEPDVVGLHIAHS